MEIGVANHPHFMNPRLTKGQTGTIVPDAIRIARELKHNSIKIMKAKTKTKKKRKADMAREAREEREEEEHKTSPRMTRAASARNASWCRKMQRWGDKKKNRRFY